MINNKLNIIFKKEHKLERKSVKLKQKQDKLFDKKSTVAFELYREFIKNNSSFNQDLDYYNIYIESGYFLAEELIFKKVYDNFIEFRHKSPHRQNHCVNLFVDTEQKDYISNSAVIDKTQFDKLSEEFKIKIRE